MHNVAIIVSVIVIMLIAIATPPVWYAGQHAEEPAAARPIWSGIRAHRPAVR